MTVLDEHHDILAVAAPADFGAGSGPAWLDAWLAPHAGELVGWRRSLHAVPELGRAERAHHRVRRRRADRRPGSSRARCPAAPGWSATSGAASAASRCAPTSTRSRCRRTPACRSPRRSRASCTPAGTTRTPRCCSAPGSRSPRAPALPGRVRLIFQPAEEIQPGGAMDVVADGAMEGVERIFALHCDPRLRVGRLGARTGPITRRATWSRSGSTSPGGHTSRPHLTADLVEALGLLITQLPLLLTRQVDPRSGTVAGLGRGARGRGGQRDPAARRAARHPAHRRPRHVGGAGGGPRAGRPRSSRRRGAGTPRHLRGVPPVVNEAASAPGCWPTRAVAMLRARRVGEHRAVQRRRGLRLVPGARARRHGAAGRVVGHRADARHPRAHLRPGRARAPLRRCGVAWPTRWRKSLWTGRLSRPLSIARRRPRSAHAGCSASGRLASGTVVRVRRTCCSGGCAGRRRSRRGRRPARRRRRSRRGSGR